MDDNISKLIKEVVARQKQYTKAILYLEKYKVFKAQLATLKNDEKTLLKIVSNLKKSGKYDKGTKLPNKLTMKAIFGYDENERKEMLKAVCLLLIFTLILDNTKSIGILKNS